jgi:DNA polymerase-1
MTPSFQQTHLLIDGDVIAFSAAAAVQRNYMDDFGYMWPFASAVEGEAVVENMLWGLKVGLKGKDEVRMPTSEVYLSDPKENWRTSVDPTYKTNRVGVRPMLLDHLKQYLRDKHGAVHWEGLEADDTLSILMTTPRTHLEEMPSLIAGVEGSDRPRRVICVGRDKDFKTIPGLHHSIRMDVSASGGMLVREVSKAEADRFHLMQALAGDRTDGFDGCPGIGLDRAEKIIANPVRLVPEAGVKTRGKDKGGAVTRWFSEPTNDYWACIVSHYRKQGLTEKHALITARLARLLRYGEYDNGAVTLWTPEVLQREGIRP